MELWKPAVNWHAERFKLSGLRLDNFGQPLTNSCFRAETGRNGLQVTIAGTHTWHTRANGGANGEMGTRELLAQHEIHRHPGMQRRGVETRYRRILGFYEQRELRAPQHDPLRPTLAQRLDLA